MRFPLNFDYVAEAGGLFVFQKPSVTGIFLAATSQISPVTLELFADGMEIVCPFFAMSPPHRKATEGTFHALDDEAKTRQDSRIANRDCCWGR